MKIQIFQHLPTLPKAGIFCPSPILCVAFRAFIPDRSVFRCFPLPCLSMFRPLVLMHKSAHSAAHPAAPPNHACAPHTPIHSTPAYRHPPPHFPHKATTRQRQGAARPPPPLYSHHSPEPRSCHTHHHTCRFTVPPHTSTHRPASCTGHQTPAPGTAHPPPALYSLPLPHTALARRTRQFTAHPHTNTHRPTSHTGHQPPAPGTAHPHPPLYSLLLL